MEIRNVKTAKHQNGVIIYQYSTKDNHSPYNYKEDNFIDPEIGLILDTNPDQGLLLVQQKINNYEYSKETI